MILWHTASAGGIIRGNDVMYHREGERCLLFTQFENGEITHESAELLVLPLQISSACKPFQNFAAKVKLSGKDMGCKLRSVPLVLFITLIKCASQ